MINVNLKVPNKNRHDHRRLQPVNLWYNIDAEIWMASDKTLSVGLVLRTTDARPTASASPTKGVLYQEQHGKTQGNIEKDKI